MRESASIIARVNPAEEKPGNVLQFKNLSATAWFAAILFVCEFLL